MNKKILARLAAAALPFLPCFALPARAAEISSVSLESGYGNGASMWRLGAQRDWTSRWFQSENWHLGGYWDAQIGQWGGEGKNTITDIGLTPVFRYQQNVPEPFSPYFEGAIGFHLIQPTQIDASRNFSTAFQFGDHVGFGARFGESGRYDASVRFQHLSNAGIKKPNDGINFLQFRFQLHLD
jgi:lipid A 3-O-deacylase